MTAPDALRALRREPHHKPDTQTLAYLAWHLRRARRHQHLAATLGATIGIAVGWTLARR